MHKLLSLAKAIQEVTLHVVRGAEPVVAVLVIPSPFIEAAHAHGDMARRVHGVVDGHQGVSVCDRWVGGPLGPVRARDGGLTGAVLCPVDLEVKRRRGVGRGQVGHPLGEGVKQILSIVGHIGVRFAVAVAVAVGVAPGARELGHGGTAVVQVGVEGDGLGEPIINGMGSLVDRVGGPEWTHQDRSPTDKVGIGVVDRLAEAQDREIARSVGQLDELVVDIQGCQSRDLVPGRDQIVIQECLEQGLEVGPDRGIGETGKLVLSVRGQICLVLVQKLRRRDLGLGKERERGNEEQKKQERKNCKRPAAGAPPRAQRQGGGFKGGMG